MKLTRRTRILLWSGATLLLLAVLATGLWIYHFRRFTPEEVMLDIRAGIAVRNEPQPLEPFLELRYGPMTDPANRRKAFLNFFNPEHIQGMNLLVSHMPAAKRQANINATAEWIARYRKNMTPEEKQSLGNYLRTKDAARTLQQATAEYLSQDVHYRAASAAVIAELMTTLAEVQKP
jgi:hypothetical protein